ncbi:MAG: hypothetical protein AAGC54_19625 [Cyanobacteria bacterium P01_F01_bin.4]
MTPTQLVRTRLSVPVLLEKSAMRMGCSKRNLLHTLMIAYGVILAAGWGAVLTKQDVKPGLKCAAIVMTVGFWGVCEGYGMTKDADRQRAIIAIEGALGKGYVNSEES